MYFLIENYDGDTFVSQFETVEQLKDKIEVYANDQQKFKSTDLDETCGNGKLIPSNNFVVVKGNELNVDVIENKAPKFSITVTEK